MKRSTFSHPQSWSIILFGFNEAATLERVAQEVLRVLAKIAPDRAELLIVDDGSTDGSVEKIEKFQKKHPQVRALFHPKNRGIGQTLRTGYFSARNENVCAVPADGQFDPRELLPFGRIEPKTFLSFFRKRQEGYSLYRRFLSASNRLINQVLLGYNLEDVNWVKVYKRKDLLGLDLKLQSSLIESEICAKLILKGHKFIQTPSVYHQRTAGRAKGGGMKTVLKAVLDIVNLAKVVREFRVTLGG